MWWDPLGCQIGRQIGRQMGVGWLSDGTFWHALQTEIY